MNKLYLLGISLVVSTTSLLGVGGKKMASPDSSLDTSIVDCSEVPFEVNKDYVYGITDLSWQEYLWSGIDYIQSHNLFEALGAKSVRFWVHSRWVLSSPTTIHTTNYRWSRQMLEDLKKRNPDYQIIGMNHTSFKQDFPKGLTNVDVQSSKPARDLSSGSLYLKWLKDYEDSWFTLVTAYPDIEYWEIDNETNNPDFMKKIGAVNEEDVFTVKEMAQITYDMMYFASRGIHRANPNAKTVMGGLIRTNVVEFLNDLYDCIFEEKTWPSDNPKHYFQIAAWHPYIQAQAKQGLVTLSYKQTFINANKEFYNVIKTREGKDKKVFITETGFNDYYNFNGQDKSAQYMGEMFEAAKNDLPFIECIHYYRMYDEENAYCSRYGLFTDPLHERIIGQSNLDKNVKVMPGKATPKPGAFVFQEGAGGSGDLYQYAKYLRY